MRKIQDLFAVLMAVTIVLSFSVCISAEEEVKVPLSAIKLSKYGKLTSEQLDKEEIVVPRTWVKEDWLEESKESTNEKEASEKITVPFSAVKTSKYGELTSEQFSKKEVTVKRSWVKEDWLQEKGTSKQTDKMEIYGKRSGLSSQTQVILCKEWITQRITMFKDCG